MTTTLDDSARSENLDRLANEYTHFHASRLLTSEVIVRSHETYFYV